MITLIKARVPSKFQQKIKETSINHHQIAVHRQDYNLTLCKAAVSN